MSTSVYLYRLLSDENFDAKADRGVISRISGTTQLLIDADSEVVVVPAAGSANAALIMTTL
jgi:hypothetical protein